MSIIYQPAGRAKEYCELAANLYLGVDTPLFRFKVNYGPQGGDARV